MRAKILVDSSIWIGFLRENCSAEIREKIYQGLRSETFYLTAPVWAEIYRGVRSRKEESDLANLVKICGWLEFDRAAWQVAAETGRACVKAGVNVPSGDVLVHACARRHGAELFHQDKHFSMIDKVCSV
jgi:predicted nucleic acid-binding protein